MSTITFFTDKKPACVGVGTNMFMAENIIDFSRKKALAGDVVQCLNIPKGAYVLNVMVTVLTAEGATCTATVGDADGANSWDASTNLNATAGTVTAGVSGTDAYALTGKTYTSDDTIDLTMGHDADTAKISVCTCYGIIEALANSEV